jgi:hypothetical protein
MTQVDRVILDPANPHDFELSELQDLAAQLQPKLPDAEITPVLRSEEGYGGPWSEVLYIWLEVKDNVDAIGFLAIAWSKKRWHRDRDKHPPPEKPRPRTITVIQEETITRTVTIDLPDGEPVDEEPTPGEPLPHPEPSPEQDDLRP